MEEDASIEVILFAGALWKKKRFVFLSVELALAITEGLLFLALQAAIFDEDGAEEVENAPKVVDWEVAFEGFPVL